MGVVSKVWSWLRQWYPWVCAGLLLATAIVCGCVWWQSWEEHAPVGWSELHPELGVPWTATDGSPCTVNASSAVFAFDVSDENAHTRRLFPSHAAALAYCREHDLPTIPATGLVLARLKHYDEAIVAAVELAVHHGVDGAPWPGKSEAVRTLAERLEKADDAPAQLAAAYLRGAIDGTPAAPDRIAQPVGIWSDPELRDIYVHDRLLCEGLGGTNAAEQRAAIRLAAEVAGDAELADAFGRYASVFAHLCNPPDGTRLPGELGAMLPEGFSPSSAKAVEAVRQRVASAWGGGWRFGLIAYADSPEKAIIDRHADRLVLGREQLLGLILDRVRSGELSLALRDNSGWYDRQWFALETLILPRRAAESAKLRLGAGYKARWQAVFAASVVGNRETHMKQFSIPCLGANTPPQRRVVVHPRFSVEPSMSVYLRHARAYRVLQEGLRDAFAPPPLSAITVDRGVSARPLDRLIDELSQLCYGLCELLAFDLGFAVPYTDGELDEEQRNAAREAAQSWLEQLDGDPALAADRRFAVPLFLRSPRGPMCHWGNLGVRLQRVRYDFAVPPASADAMVDTRPWEGYLALDVCREFDADSVLDREAFRQRLAGCASVRHAEKRLQLVRAPGGRGIGAGRSVSAIRLLVVVLLVLVYRHRLSWRRIARCVPVTVLGALVVAAVVTWFVPSLRVRAYVQWLRLTNANPWEPNPCWRWLKSLSWEERDSGFLRQAGSGDSQSRYLALASLLQWTIDSREADRRKPLPEPLASDVLFALADGPNPHLSELAIWQIGTPRKRGAVAFLAERLERARDQESQCLPFLQAVWRTRSPEAVPCLLDWIDDPRPGVRREAAFGLTLMEGQEALTAALGLSDHPSPAVRQLVLSELGSRDEEMTEEELALYRGRLLAAMTDGDIPLGRRVELLRTVHDRDWLVRCVVALGPEAVRGPEDTELVSKVIDLLSWTQPSATEAIPWLESLSTHPDQEVRRRATEAIEDIRETEDILFGP